MDGDPDGSGVTVLIALLEKTGGLDLFTRSAGAARHAGHGDRRHRVRDRPDLGLQQHVRRRAAGVPADGAWAVARLGGGDPLGIATSMNIGGHLVDVSPLSTIGALCIAAIADPAQVRPTFNKLLAWGLSMTVVGAIGCYLFM